MKRCSNKAKTVREEEQECAGCMLLRTPISNQESSVQSRIS